MKPLRNLEDYLRANGADLIFVGLIAIALFFASGGIKTGFEKRYSGAGQGGARQVDLEKVKKQISEGDLSSQKALFYKKTLH